MLAAVALCHEWLSAFTQNLHALARHMEMKETTRDPPGVHNLAFRVSMVSFALWGRGRT